MKVLRSRSLWTTLLVLAGVSGWYGTYASYSNGYDSGASSCKFDKGSEEYKRGYDYGMIVGKQQSEAEAQAVMRDTVQTYERGLDQQMREHLTQAYNEGAQAEARAMVEHGWRISK